MQNSALGAVLASVHFAAYPLAAVPCAISGERWLPTEGNAGSPLCRPLVGGLHAHAACLRTARLRPPCTSCPTSAACMHSVMGSLLAAVWRGRPTGELGTQDMEVEEPLAELAGAAAAVESAVEAAVGNAASTVAGTVAGAGAAVAGTVASAGAAVLGAAARSVGAARRGAAGPGGSGSASFGRPSSGGSGSASFGRSPRQAAGRPAASTAAGSSSSNGDSGSAVSNRGGQGAGLASAADGGSGAAAPAQQRLSQQEMGRLLGSDF